MEGWIVAIGAIRIPARAASTVASTQLVAAILFAERPITAAPSSFSEAARVASPKRVKR